MKMLLVFLSVVSLIFGPVADSYANGSGSSGSSSRASTVHFQAQAETTTPGAVTPEMQSVEVYNSQDYRAAVEWAAAEAAKTSQVKTTFVTLSPEASVDPNAASLVREAAQDTAQKLGQAPGQVQEIKIIETQIPEEKLEEIKNSSGLSARDLFIKHHRLTFTVLRTTMNGVITGSALFFSAGVPLVPSLAIAVFSASMAAGFAYFQPQVQKFINGDQALKEKLMSSGLAGRVRVKTVQLSRIFAINSVTFFATQVVTLAVGAAAVGTPLEEVIKVFRSSAISTASGGIWSAANASLTYDSIEANKFNPEKHDAIHRRATMISFGVSSVSAFGSILSLMGVPLGHWTMGVIAVSGIAFSIWTSKRPKNVLHLSSGRMNLAGLRNAMQWDLGCP
jgi:hypothetical protein